MTEKNYWLVKSEPATFSMEDFLTSPHQTTFWDGVRNFQARNYLRDQIKVGDHVIIYHSSASPSGVAGFSTVVRGSEPDATALHLNSRNFDPKHTLASPIWFGVTLGNPIKSKSFLSLSLLKQTKGLSEMLLLRKGQRLSVMPILHKEYSIIWELAGLPNENLGH